MSEDEVVSEPDKKNSADSAEGVNGVSQFLGRVLNQLSLTSWMPAGMLVGVGAVLVALHAQIVSDPDGGFDLGGAVSVLTKNTLGTAVVLLVAVILAACVTQAFSFGTIRLLEGYWSGRGLSGWLLRLRTGRWLTKKDALERRKDEQWEAAFDGARSAMRTGNIPAAWIAVLEDEFGNRRDYEAQYSAS